MKLSILAGSTSQSVTIFIQDSSQTDGRGLAGLVYNTASLVAYYTFTGANAGSVAITLATLAAVNSAYSSGGFKEIDATNMPGVYRLDLPNTALAASKGRSVVVMLKGATNMAQLPIEIELTGWDNQDGVHGGMTALPNAAANAAGGLPVSIAGGLDIDEMNVDIEAIEAKTAQFVFTVANQVDANVLDWKSATAPAMTGDAYARLGAPAGASVSADVAAIKSDTGTILTDVNAGAGAIYNRLGAPAGASIAADLAEIEAETDDIAAIKAKTDQLTFTVGLHVDATATIGGNVTVGGYAAGQDPATLVLDTAAAGHNTAGSIGQKINAAGGAADPLLNAVPGSYANGTAGHALGLITSVTIANNAVSPTGVVLSSYASYCTVAQFLDLYDWRMIGDLLSDTGAKFTLSQTQNSVLLGKFLQQGCGMVESACFMGQRYQPGDLLALVTADSNGNLPNGGHMLLRMISDLTFGNLLLRRPNKDIQMPPGYRLAAGMLDRLSKGETILGLVAAAKAGVPAPAVSTVTESDLQTRKDVAIQASPLFGERSDRFRS